MGCASSKSVNVCSETKTNQRTKTNDGDDGFVCCQCPSLFENNNNNNNNNEDEEELVPVTVILDADGNFTKIVGEISISTAVALGLPPATISALQSPVHVGMEPMSVAMKDWGGGMA
eukprot:PhM_4_TR10054/c4_g1_i1/m.42534